MSDFQNKCNDKPTEPALTKKSSKYYDVTKKLIEKQKKVLDYIQSIYGGDDNNPEKLECIGNWYYYNGDISNASKYYIKAIKQDSNYYCARYHYLIARKSEGEGNYEEAVKYYCSAIEIENTFVDTYVDFGVLLIKIADYETAEAVLLDGIKIDEEEPALYLNLISLYEMMLNKKNLNYSAKLLDLIKKYQQVFGEPYNVKRN